MDPVALASVITSGLVGIAGLVFAAWNARQTRLARRTERESDEHSELVQRGADALAPMMTLLTNFSPDRSEGFRHWPSFDELTAEYEERRVALNAFALSHPSPEVLDLVGRFEAAIARAVPATREASEAESYYEYESERRQILDSRDVDDGAQDRTRELGRKARELRDVAVSEYAEAQRLAAELQAAIVRK